MVGVSLHSNFARATMTKALMDTEAGLIELELFEADAPNTVANFVKLAKDGFYDGLAFHRVIPGFMAQGGCPNSREGARGMAGTGGPGYQIDCEINQQKHQAGTLAMAHAGRNTGGSQFYICHDVTLGARRLPGDGSGIARRWQWYVFRRRWSLGSGGNRQ